MADTLGGKVAGFTVIGLTALIAALWFGLYLYAGDKAPRNAKVEGVSIAGLTPGAAEKKLRARLEPRTSEPIAVTYGDGRAVTVDPQEAGLSIDYPASIRAAGGGSGLDPGRMWDLISGGGDHHAEVAVDQTRMQATLDDLSSGIGGRPVEGDVVFRAGRAVPVFGSAGLVISRGAAQDLLVRRFLHGGSQKLPSELRQPEVSAAAVREAMRSFGTPAMSAPVTLVLAGERVSAPPRLFERGLSMEAVDGRLEPRVDGELMLEALDPVMRTIGREPEDARIELRDGRPHVVPARVGVAVSPQELEERFTDVAVRTGAQRRIVLHGAATKPSFTTADAEALKVTEQVSTFTTSFPFAEYLDVNLPRAAALIDGTLLRPGETFSFDDAVGEPSKAHGFTEGYVVADGTFTKDRGGGISQIATTAFNAAFFAGLEVVERRPHPVYVDRYPEGRDADVKWPSVDLRFTNDTHYGVLISAHVRRATPTRDGAATVAMYSTRRWRITSSHGPRTHVTAPRVRRVRSPGCQPTRGTPGFGVDVFRAFHPLGSSKVVRKEKFHSDYVAGYTVRCTTPPRPRPKPKPSRHP